MKNSSLIKVGVITSAHGIRGQVKIRSFTNQPKDIFACSVISDASGKQFRLIPQGGMETALIASIDGITDRNAAEALKGTELFTRADALPKKKKGEYYPHELIGLEARLTDGKKYGKVTAVHNFGAGEIIEINDKEMLPFNPAFIGEVNIEKGYISVHLPEYVEENTPKPSK